MPSSGTKDLRTLALLGLFAAAVFALAGAFANWVDSRTAPAEPVPGPVGPPGWMVDDLLAEARDITRKAAEDGPGAR